MEDQSAESFNFTNAFMYNYYEFIKNTTNDYPKDLRFCDGGMQRYLEERWSKETDKSTLYVRIQKVGHRIVACEDEAIGAVVGAQDGN